MISTVNLKGQKFKIMPSEPTSPSWSTTTKVFVAAFTFVFIGLAIWRFQTIIGPIVTAGMIAYLLDPIITWIYRHTPLSRGSAIGLIYPLFAAIVLAILIAAGVTIYTQAVGLIVTLNEIIWAAPEQLNSLLSQPVHIGSLTVDPSQLNLDPTQVSQQVITVIQPVMTRSAQVIGQAASTTVTWIGWAILIFVLSIYFAIDLPRFGSLISQSIHQPGYRRDVERMLTEFKLIWNSYLRGRSTLAMIMGILFTVVMWLLGVRFALALGILAFFLDFIPYLGPSLIVILTTLVALFQGDNWLGINQMWFGIIVMVFGVIAQQVEGNWLIPLIVGKALNMHPLLVLIGVVMGSSLAGILGMILSAPVLATITLLGTYGWRKMFDLDPFPKTKTATKINPDRAPPEQKDMIGVDGRQDSKRQDTPSQERGAPREDLTSLSGIE